MLYIHFSLIFIKNQSGMSKMISGLLDLIDSFNPWCLDGRMVGKSLSRLYLRNRKVYEVDTW